MFNLIVAVLSIALIGITAGASVYYGGTAFSNSNNRGQVSALISAGGQIGAAQSLHRTENGGVGAENVAALISKSYLQAQPSVPTGLPGAGEWTLVDGGKMALLMIGDEAAADGSAADLVCEKVVVEGGARLIATEVASALDTPPYAGSFDSSAQADIADITVLDTLDTAEAVNVENYNDGRRVNFACLEMTDATYYGYRI